MAKSTSYRRHTAGPRVAPKPIGAVRLEELALAYVARFSVSAAKLADYLRRKLRSRGWEGEGEPPIDAIVARFVAAGYVDDAVYARNRSAGMLRRGLGMRRVAQAMHAAGIAPEHRSEAAPGPAAERQAALALARRRRLGPYGTDANDRAGREKQIAVMLRAGHPLDSARELVDAASIAAAEDWAAECDGDEACD